MDKKTIELEKYKRGCVARDTVINELKEEVAGQYQLIELLSAFITLLIRKRKRTISKKELSETIGKYEISIAQDEENYEVKAVAIKGE